MDSKFDQYFSKIILLLSTVISGGNLYFPRLPLLIVLILLCILYSLSTNQFIYIKRGVFRIYILLIVIFYITLFNSGSSDYLNSLLIRFANFLGALSVILVYYKNPKVNFVSDLKFWLNIFVYLVLITEIIVILMPNLVTISFPDISELRYFNTYTVLGVFMTVESDSFFSLPRACGFFWEPGILQCYLNIYLYIILIHDRRSIKNTILPFIAILLTQSTVGLILMFLIYSYYFLIVSDKISFNRRIIKVFITILILVPLYFILSANIKNKFSGELSGSFLARQYDSLSGWKVALKNPIVGIGFSHKDFTIAQRKYGFKNTELDIDTIWDRVNTNSIIMLIYYLGFPFAIYFIWKLYNQSFFCYSKLLFFLILFVSFTSEPILFSPFFLLFPFSGLINMKSITETQIISPE